MIIILTTVSLGYANTEDLVSQLLTERLMLFHSQTPAPVLLLPTSIGTSLTTSPGGSVLASRYLGQGGRVGMVAYLIDCYERVMYEDRYVKVHSYNT